jgi:hypothetical protein
MPRAYDNDENTLIIHDHELARACYAKWQRLWVRVPVERTCNVIEMYLPVVLSPQTPPKIRGTVAPPMSSLPAIQRGAIIKV